MKAKSKDGREAETLIRADNICFGSAGGAGGAGKKKILDRVSTVIKRGDFTTIIGPNGAGKTTLIKILLGNLKPNKGAIERQKNLRIGYVPQKLEIGYFMPISVEYFLRLNQKIHQFFFEKIVDDTGVGELLGKQLYVLSGGEMQRVLLAKAVLNKPDLLILDEPAQNLDISGQLTFYELLNGLYKRDSMTILMVSHDLHMVMSATKQVICLHNHICCAGKPETVAKNPKFISIFGDSMSKIMSVYGHYHDHKH